MTGSPRRRPRIATQACRCGLVLVAWACGLAWPAAAAAAPSQDAAGALEAVRPAGAKLLDVPYVAQGVDLCGAAAAVMVQRYWGHPGRVEEYAHLVDPVRHGISTEALTGDLRRRGWRALPFSGSVPEVQGHLSAGRPVIALIGVDPGRFHFVVVVSWARQTVVYHDPAVAPLRTAREAQFVEAWQVAGGWGLLLLPGAGGTGELDGSSDSPAAGRPVVAVAGPSDGASAPGLIRGPDEPPGVPATAGDAPEIPAACRVPFEAGLEAAGVADLESAGRALQEAAARCPRWATARRELGGVRFLEGRWREAAAEAGHAARLDPADLHASRLEATARFLEGDRMGALEAWNRAGEPRIDTVDIEGTGRTRRPVVARSIDLAADGILTARGLRHARRRLAELPFVSWTGVRYEPPAGGRTRVVAGVVEKPLLPDGPVEIAAAAGRSLAARRLGVEVVSPTGGGEVWEAWWRWHEGRPGAGLRLRLPASPRRPGVWTVDVFRSRESLAGSAAGVVAGPSGAAGAVSGEVRRDRLGIGFSDWVRADLRWEVAGGWDRRSTTGSHLYTAVGLETRDARDGLVARFDGAFWMPVGGSPGTDRGGAAAPRRDVAGPGTPPGTPGGPFAEGGALLAWRPRGRPAGVELRTVAGFRAVAGEAPWDVWPGAGTGGMGEPLLRAHALHEDGAIQARGLGRRLVHGGIELRRRVVTVGPVGIVAAAFVDLARTAGGLVAPGASLHADAGGGLRLALPGQPGVLRVDVARGMVDGATAVSVGWELPWPGSSGRRDPRR